MANVAYTRLRGEGVGFTANNANIHEQIDANVRSPIYANGARIVFNVIIEVELVNSGICALKFSKSTACSNKKSSLFVGTLGRREVHFVNLSLMGIFF